jgi:hypothetical protein
MSASRFSTTPASLLRAASVAATAALIVLTAGAAHAQTVYLVGADFYSATSNGTDGQPAVYLEDTNSSVGTSPFELVLNGVTTDKGIAIQLASGANNFTINPTPGNNVDPGNYVGIGLYFSTTPTSYNPASNARTPDLAFATAVASSIGANFTPAAGIAVANYVFGSTSSANGLKSINEGTMPVSVSNFVATHSATGSFTVNVGSTAAAPEPGSVALFGSCLVPLTGLIARRRRANSGSAKA